MRRNVVLAAFGVMAAFGGWATAEAADRDDYYVSGYHYYYYPYRSDTYYYYPNGSYTYYAYPDRGYTYYYNYSDPYYGGNGDPHRNYLNQHSYNRLDPYGIENHDTN